MPSDKPSFGPSPKEARGIARALLDAHAETCPTCGHARRNSRAQNIAGTIAVGVIVALILGALFLG